MITDADVKKLKEVFATKDDLVDVIQPIKKSLKRIEKKLDMTITHFDKNYNYHHRRLDQLEEKAGVKPPPFLSPIN